MVEAPRQIPNDSISFLFKLVILLRQMNSFKSYQTVAQPLGIIAKATKSLCLAKGPIRTKIF